MRISVILFLILLYTSNPYRQITVVYIFCTKFYYFNGLFVGSLFTSPIFLLKFIFQLFDQSGTVHLVFYIFKLCEELGFDLKHLSWFVR